MTQSSAPSTLTGKVALVTGATRGIGRAIAWKLARSGADIVVNYYNSHEQAEALCAEIRALGRRAIAVKASVAVPDSVDELFAELHKAFDRIDIVVSNAASGVLKPAMEMTLKHWRWCLETNALALNLLAQRAVPLKPSARNLPVFTCATAAVGGVNSACTSPPITAIIAGATPL